MREVSSQIGRMREREYKKERLKEGEDTRGKAVYSKESARNTQKKTSMQYTT